MSSWYPYRWVCKKCKAVHYFEVTECRNCEDYRIRREVNSQSAVDALKSTKKRRATKPAAIPRIDEDEDEGAQILRDSPVEADDDDAVPGKSGETTVRQSESPDDLDDMINNILEG